MKSEYHAPVIEWIFYEQTDILTASTGNVRLAPGEYGVEDFFE